MLFLINLANNSGRLSLHGIQSKTAKENLMRKIDAENTTFSTIESYKRKALLL